MDLQEIIKFNEKIVLPFSDLQDDLKYRIQKKLSEQQFYDKPFEVKSVLEFKIKEMIVLGYTIVCNLEVTAICNNPKIGKNITIDEFEIRKDTIIYNKDRIQIIAKKPNNDKSIHYTLRIDALKIVSKNILCVASIV